MSWRRIVPFKAIGAATVVLAFATSAAAQDAGIIGQVTDDSGAVMPGVTVTATSPALQVPSVVAVTDEKGEYRLSPLPIGTFAVEYSLSGFQSVKRDGIRLTVGFTARIDVPLKVGSLEETITVSGAAPVVDTTSTAATTQFTRETIELLPTSRNGIVSLLAQAPGVRTLRDVGGSSLNQVPTYRVFGQAGEAYSTLEGVQTSSLQASSGQANYWDYTALEEASVRTLGNSAEVPSRGVNLVAIVKSGGNDFHSATSYNKTGPDFQSDNIDDELRARGLAGGSTLADRYSISSDIGGRIIRDKLWFYVAGRRQIDDQQPLNTFKPDGSPAIAKELSWFYTSKLSYQMSQANRLVGFYAYNHKYDTSTLSQFTPWEYRGGLMTPSRTAKAELQRVWSNQFVTSAQMGFWTYDSHYWSFAPREVPPSLDLVTQMNAGPQNTVGQRPHNPRYHYKANATWYKPELYQGSHEFKFGFDYTDNWFGRQYPLLDPNLTIDGGPDNEGGRWPYSSWVWSYRLRPSTQAGQAPFASCQVAAGATTPCRIELWNNPAEAKVVTHYFGTYITDSWTVGRRLTLNLGLRYAHDNGFVPESCQVAAAFPADAAFPAACREKQQFNIWDSVAPRMHASWDIAGNGKTVLKGGWGRFDHERQQVPELDAADWQLRTTTTFRWRDYNGNHVYDAGESNLNPNGADFLSQSGGSNTVPCNHESAALLGCADERQPKSDEISLSLERELGQNFGVRASYVYSRYRDTYRILNTLRPCATEGRALGAPCPGSYDVPVVQSDPGPDGIRGNADDPRTSAGLPVFFTYYEYSAALAGRANERFVRVNDPAADQKYNSIDIAMSKRLSKNWQLTASYSATRRNVPLLYSDLTAAASTGAGEFNGNVESAQLTPNNEINAADKEWEYSTKLSGVYQLPYGILTSANYEARSGYPWARQVQFTGGRTVPNMTINVEPNGSRRLPVSNQLDVRFEKTFAMPHGQKLAVRSNIFNILNDNTILEITRLSGPNFDRPTTVMDARIVEIGFTYSF
jgi:Carboxypeptidase regulatory-like domain